MPAHRLLNATTEGVFLLMRSRFWTMVGFAGLITATPALLPASATSAESGLTLTAAEAERSPDQSLVVRTTGGIDTTAGFSSPSSCVRCRIHSGRPAGASVLGRLPQARASSTGHSRDEAARWCSGWKQLLRPRSFLGVATRYLMEAEVAPITDLNGCQADKTDIWSMHREFKTSCAWHSHRRCDDSRAGADRADDGRLRPALPAGSSRLGAAYVATEMVACDELGAGRPDVVRRAAVGDGLPLM